MNNGPPGMSPWHGGNGQGQGASAWYGPPGAYGGYGGSYSGPPGGPPPGWVNYGPGTGAGYGAYSGYVSTCTLLHCHCRMCCLTFMIFFLQFFLLPAV